MGWAFFLSVQMVAADRPQWGQRGSRNMVSEEKGLPDSFDPATGRNIKWSARLGTDTYSTPVIANGHILIGTNNGVPRDRQYQGDRGVVMCFDEKTGRFLWQLVVPKLSKSVYWDWPNAGICSSASVEGNRVYIVSNRGEVLCLDLHGMADGNEGPFDQEARHAALDQADPSPLSPTDADIIWLFDMIKDCGVRQHDSAHSSILIHGSLLYINTSNGVDDSHKKIDSPQAPSLVVLDKLTGRLIATDKEQIGPRIFHSSWSSPSLGLVLGRPLIFFGGGDGVLYAFEAFQKEAVPNSFAVQNPGRTAPFPANEQMAGLKKVWQFDCDLTAPKEEVHRYNGNRRESPSNIKSMPVFHQNRIYLTVGGDHWWGKNQAWLKCIDTTGSGDITRTGEVWSYPLVRHSMCTPAVYNGLVFVGDSGRRIHCVDAGTGKPYWTHDVQGEIWASPLAADDKVYFATRQGEFIIFAANREKRLLYQINLGNPLNSSPVAANGVLYLATMTHLYAIQNGARK